MKLLTPASGICFVSLILGGCQSFSLPDIPARLSAIDLSLDSSMYIVRPGETLDSIAFRYDIPVARLQQLNPVTANGVQAGMHIYLRMPGGDVSQSVQAANTATPLPRFDSNKVVETAPVETRQAVPIEPIASIANDSYANDTYASDTYANDSYANDSFAGNRERFNRSVPKIAQMRSGRSTGYVDQPGYPVEEIIDDENFMLPPSQNAMVSDNQITVADDAGNFNQPWQWPLSGQLARDYDPARTNGRGIEIVGLPGQQVSASRDGVVEWVARSPDGVGKVVIVRHEDDYLSIYSNAQDLYVSMHDTVRQGDPIASLGANVNDEQLLRFEISKNGNLLNPMNFLAAR